MSSCRRPESFWRISRESPSRRLALLGGVLAHLIEARDPFARWPAAASRSCPWRAPGPAPTRSWRSTASAGSVWRSATTVRTPGQTTRHMSEPSSCKAFSTASTGRRHSSDSETTVSSYLPDCANDRTSASPNFAGAAQRGDPLPSRRCSPGGDDGGFGFCRARRRRTRRTSAAATGFAAASLRRTASGAFSTSLARWWVGRSARSPTSRASALSRSLRRTSAPKPLSEMRGAMILRERSRDLLVAACEQDVGQRLADRLACADRQEVILPLGGRDQDERIVIEAQATATGPALQCR